MSNTGRVLFKLSFLVVAWCILLLLLFNDVGNGGVGGGGYDLSGLVYGSMLFGATVIWLLWVTVSYFRSMHTTEKKANLVLLIVGLAALVAAWFIIPDLN